MYVLPNMLLTMNADVGPHDLTRYIGMKNHNLKNAIYTRYSKGTSPYYKFKTLRVDLQYETEKFVQWQDECSKCIYQCVIAYHLIVQQQSTLKMFSHLN